MKKTMAWAGVLLIMLACAPAEAFEFRYPGHIGCPPEVVDGLLAAWTDVICVEGEMLECGTSILLKDISGKVAKIPVTSGVACFINGYPGSPVAMQPVDDAPFFARCYISGGHLLLVDATFAGFECRLLAYRPGSIHVRLPDGIERDMALWPQQDLSVRAILAQGPVVASLFVLIDPEGRVRRIWRSDMSG